MRAVVNHWRSKGQNIIVFLDDGLGGNVTFDKALSLSQFIKADLQLFGFLLAEEKCIWYPTQVIVWLGYVWNTISGVLSVTEERMLRFERLVVSYSTRCVAAER
jgi:hypothetical protein